MSADTRLARGDNPEDVAKLFGITVEEAKARQKALKPKKAPRKATSKRIK